MHNLCKALWIKSDYINAPLFYAGHGCSYLGGLSTEAGVEATGGTTGTVRLGLAISSPRNTNIYYINILYII